MYANNLLNSNPSASLEMLANEIHNGWCVNYKYWRDNNPENDGIHIKPFNKLGDERRNMCASTKYIDLPEDEKNKDIMIAEYLIAKLNECNH